MKALTLNGNHVNVFWKIFPICSNESITITYLDENGKRDITLNPYYFYFNVGPEIALWAELPDGSMDSYSLYGILNVTESNKEFIPDTNKINLIHTQVDDYYVEKFMPSPSFTPRIKTF
jgi:hypothetical protein